MASHSSGGFKGVNIVKHHVCCPDICHVLEIERTLTLRDHHRTRDNALDVSCVIRIVIIIFVLKD